MNAYSWEQLSIGLEHSFSATVTADMMAHFLQDTGDANPLHTDGAYASRHGFRAPVAYGMLTSSFYSTLVGMYLPGQYALLHGIEIAFVNPVFVGDVLTIKGTITYLNEAFHQIQLSGHIATAGGTEVSRAKIRVGVLSPGGDSGRA